MAYVKLDPSDADASGNMPNGSAEQLLINVDSNRELALTKITGVNVSKIETVSALPETPVADTLYIVIGA